ncbi:MAG: VWA domain-containing protein [Anaerolineae bacterium]|nr:VWA domain-containing protein [Anaerolineae bacterium]
MANIQTGPLDRVRINVFLLLDTSASMTGAPLEALKQGVSLVYTTFASRSTHSVSIAAISYDSDATLLLPLRDVSQTFNLPELDPGGTSSLGKALRLTEQQIHKSARTLIYVFTDGEESADDWNVPLKSLKPHIQNIYAVLCGITPQHNHPCDYADDIFLMRELTPDTIFSTFRTLT